MSQHTHINNISVADIKSRIKNLHFLIWDAVRKAIMSDADESIRRVAGKGAGDISYEIDVHAERIIEEFFSGWDLPGGIVVVSEGLGVKTFPKGVCESDALLRCIIDPIDGTRMIMYCLRSAWILTGVAPNKGNMTSMQDIVFSMQTEIPIPKQALSSVVYAAKGNYVIEELWDIGNRTCAGSGKNPHSSLATGLEHGYSVFVNPFLGDKTAITALGDRIIKSQLGNIVTNEALVYHDEPISSGAQLYYVATGRYRFVADIRSKVAELMETKGCGYTLCAHPYDISTFLIAVEAGCIVTDLEGKPLNYILDTETNVGWIAYANPVIQKSIESELLKEIGMLQL